METINEMENRVITPIPFPIQETIQETNEPKRTIFEGLRSFNFQHDLRKVLRFNYYFSKMGFERVNINKEFGQYTYYPQLTLMINPSLVVSHDTDVNQSYEHLTSWSIQRREPTFDLWDKFFYGKKGYLGLRQHSIIKRNGNEDVKPIKIEFEGKEMMLGHYLKERNIVMLYINPFNTDYSTENNEYLELVLKLFEDKIKEIELKKVDVSEKMKMALTDKFKKEIVYKLNEVRENLRCYEEEVSNCQASLLKAIRNTQVNRKQIEGLINFSTSTDETIKRELDELKKLPFVTNIRLTSKGISLDIDDIKIKQNNEDVYIGDFNIVISPNGVKVYCKNSILDDEGNVTAHPHIDGDNNCYGGEREQKIMEFLSNFELKNLVFYINMFLKTYTANDSYHSISLWQEPELERVSRKQTEDNEDIFIGNFQGDLFREPTPPPRMRSNEDENYDDEDDGERDDYIGDCNECGDSIYENDNDNWVRGNNNEDYIFCCNECRDAYEREHP